MRKWIVLAGLLALAACGDDSDRITAVDKSPAPETGAAAAVAKLDEAQRNGVLERAVRASGAACPTVAKSERTQVRPGVTGWKAQCDNGTAHLIEIQPDGNATVTSRTH
ncbi:hypothetical protein [Sphingobium chlorophenolicum]|uniref:Lipoprotein n=1 Tax=Sphingobium chlorophenolicum TaxID=46429 RepID=A0A081R8X1_SPHCR|nr:hypothetical protein [Sphingobium chlorophenolicum]KEQ51644.1 putative uncharacterized protein precursor [Sphingobium chlorophenolicum]